MANATRSEHARLFTRTPRSLTGGHHHEGQGELEAQQQHHQHLRTWEAGRRARRERCILEQRWRVQQQRLCCQVALRWALCWLRALKIAIYLSVDGAPACPPPTDRLYAAFYVGNKKKKKKKNCDQLKGKGVSQRYLRRQDGLQYEFQRKGRERYLRRTTGRARGGWGAGGGAQPTRRRPCWVRRSRACFGSTEKCADE